MENLILELLKTVLPGLLVTLTANVVKKIKEGLSGAVILGIVVPVLSALIAVVAYFTIGANVWPTFLLGLVSTFFYELKKQLEA